MPRRIATQLNIRSTFAHTRATELSRQTGMTATEVVEDALRGYAPPGGSMPVGALVWSGPLLVMPTRDGRRITLEDANDALDATRDRAP